ncbi:cytoplasmic FMR1 interacting protein [Vigna unguiculata]|uniref:Cytoplasmic FMR1 interacting protein n=1 Tax=Vigna unguiculata TaxID=3917 RepID=A0A4D6KKM2_VIGUN|nr:cytoplasmic FMR1 interacting protein [Vigna unguiculata]
MAVPVEEAIAALSTFSLEDEQPEVQGPGVWVSTERGATESPIVCESGSKAIVPLVSVQKSRANPFPGETFRVALQWSGRNSMAPVSGCPWWCPICITSSGASSSGVSRGIHHKCKHPLNPTKLYVSG